MLLHYSPEVDKYRDVVPVTNRTIIERLPFYVTMLGHFDCGSQYFTEREGYPECLLIYTVKGKGSMQYQGEKVMIPENCAVLIDCRKYQFYRSEGERWEFYWIHFDGKCASDFVELVNHSGLEVIPVGRSLDVVSCFFDMRHLASAGGWEMEVSLSDCVHHMLSTLISLQHRQVSIHRYRSQMPDIEKALDFIHERFFEDITVEQMAEQARMSKYHFIRTFRGVVGDTPYHYLALYRIHQSQKLLAETSLSVQEIALQVGFANSKNFIACFKKHVFVTPSQYRQQMPA